MSTCRKSNSLTLTRVFSQHRVHGSRKFDSRTSIHGTDSGNIESRTSVRKSSCGGSESDGEYETSSEGRLLPGPETRPSRCKTRKSASASTSPSPEAKVSTEENFEIDRSSENKKISTEVKEFVNMVKNVTSSVTKVTKTSVQSIEKRDKSFLESKFYPDADRRTRCLLLDSCKTLQSMDTESNFTLSIANPSTTDVQSVYRQKKFHSDTYSCSIETMSIYKEGENSFQFSEGNQLIHERKLDVPDNNQPSIDIAANPEPIEASDEQINANHEPKKSFVKLSEIMTQINKELTPFQDKIDKIFKQVEIDLKRMPIETSNFLPISKLDPFPNNSNRFWAKVSDCNSYNNTNYIPEILPPSQERLWLNENFSFPSTCVHRPGFHACHNQFSPNYCRHESKRCNHYLNSETFISENGHLQNSFIPSSSYSLRGHRGLHVADNSRHLSLNDFPVVRHDLHSFHANVLPVNSENLHRHYKSKVPTAMRNSQVHTESKIISHQIDTKHCQKHTICHSRHSKFVDKNQSQDYVPKSTKEPRNVKKYRKHKMKECLCCNHSKRHRCSYRHRIGNSNHNAELSSADNPHCSHGFPKNRKSSVTLKNPSLNNITGNESVSEAESLQTIRKINTDVKEIVSVKESMNYKQEVESGNSSSENTIKSEMPFSLKNCALLKDSRMEKKEEMDFQAASNPVGANVLETEESSGLEKRSYSREKDLFSDSNSIKRVYTEHKESIQVSEQNVRCDKACNTESIDVPAYQDENLLNLKKLGLNTLSGIAKKSQSENFESEISNLCISKERITNTPLGSRVSENASRKSISSQHSKMNLPKTHERIAIVPIIFSSGMPESWNEKFHFMDSEKRDNSRQKQIRVESQGRLSTESDFSLSTRAESFATEITQLAKKCAFINDSIGRENSRMTLKTDSSSYSFMNSSDTEIRLGRETRARNESRGKKVSSKCSLNYETFENPARNSVTVRRIRGIITSPEDYVYE